MQSVLKRLVRFGIRIGKSRIHKHSKNGKIFCLKIIYKSSQSIFIKITVS